MSREMTESERRHYLMHGSKITTEIIALTAAGEDNYIRGRIEITLHQPEPTSGHLTFIDIHVANHAGQEIWLERIDTDKLISELQALQVAAGQPVTQQSRT